jgi:acetolactate decarboxylase
MLTRRQLMVGACCSACALVALGRRPGWAAGAAPTEIDGPGYKLRFVGSQRQTIMAGMRSSLLDLRTLQGKPQLYGVGPLEGLAGEVTIAAGRPALARVAADRSVQVTESFVGGAPFFVWAEIEAWYALPVPPEVRTYADLESFVAVTGGRNGLTQPFPFLIEGRPDSIDFHVVDAAPDTPPGMEAHAKIQIPFVAREQEALLIGFWSDRHQGIFTSMDSNIHVHFQIADNKLSGHVQGLELAQTGQVLRLPKG